MCELVTTARTLEVCAVKTTFMLLWVRANVEFDSCACGHARPQQSVTPHMIDLIAVFISTMCGQAECYGCNGIHATCTAINFTAIELADLRQHGIKACFCLLLFCQRKLQACRDS